MFDEALQILAEHAEKSNSDISVLARDQDKLSTEISRIKSELHFLGRTPTAPEVLAADRDLRAEFSFAVSDDMPNPVLALHLLRFIRDYAKSTVWDQFRSDLRTNIAPEMIRNTSRDVTDAVKPHVEEYLDAKLNRLSRALGGEVPKLLEQHASDIRDALDAEQKLKFDGIITELRTFAAGIKDGADGAAGADGADGTSLKLAGPFQKRKTYNMGEIVEFQGSSFGARKNGVRSQPKSGADWQLIAAAGAQGISYASGGGSTPDTPPPALVFATYLEIPSPASVQPGTVVSVIADSNDGLNGQHVALGGTVGGNATYWLKT